MCAHLWRFVLGGLGGLKADLVRAQSLRQKCGKECVTSMPARYRSRETTVEKALACFFISVSARVTCSCAPSAARLSVIFCVAGHAGKGRPMSSRFTQIRCSCKDEARTHLLLSIQAVARTQQTRQTTFEQPRNLRA